MDDKVTFIFGVPVPSDNRLFLAIVVVHIVLGLLCIISGTVAMLSQKTTKIHATAGKTYCWGMTVLFITVVITSFIRWPFNTHLLMVGTAAYTLTLVGQRVARSHRPNWTRLHTISMGLSFVLLLTGFYVDNGKHLPFWNQFPPLFFWLFPAMRLLLSNRFTFRQMYPGAFTVAGDNLVVNLSPDFVQCKAIERGGSYGTNDKGEECCAPVTEKKKVQLVELTTISANSCTPGSGCC